MMDEDAEMFWAEDASDYGRNALTCHYCGAYPMAWVSTENGPRMRDINGNIHSCRQYREVKEQERKRKAKR